MTTFTGRFTCDNCYAVYLGDANGVTQKLLPTGTDLGVVNTSAQAITEGESVTFNAQTSDWLYLIAWSDHAIKQGLIGAFKGTVVLNTGDAGWEVLPTGQAIPTTVNVPATSDINTHIANGNASNGWKIPTVGPVYTNSAAIYGSTFLSASFMGNLAALGANPHWVWYDSGNDTSGRPVIPFEGFNHDEFLIFRFPLRLLSPCEAAKEDGIDALEALVADKFNHLENNFGKGCAAFPMPPANPNEPGETGNLPCKPLDIPAVRPCFYLHWGDGPRDIIETEDFEVMVLSVCNPYDNVLFKGVQITNIEVVHADGSPVELLPDGSPCVITVPSKLVCLCEVAPCSCSHLELALKSDGAIEGPYKIKFSYCIEEICLVETNRGRVEFDIELVVS